METVNVGNKRILFWDDFFIDDDKTSAKLVLEHPVKKELAIDLNKEWEGDGCAYFHTVKFGDMYRMYYVAGMIEKDGESLKRSVCFIESRDGIHWSRPSLKIHEFNGSYDNNIILRQSDEDAFDNLFIFIDTNPECPEDEKVKGVGMRYDKTKPFPAERQLWCYTSSDGIHFRRAWMMTDGSVKNGGIFDSLNTVYWDDEVKKYKGYIRGIHDADEKRDIRYIESTDFKNWSEPVLLNFGDSDDYPLYTNVVSQYYREKSMLVGFPTRYIDRERWVKNYDLMGTPKAVECRKERMKDNPRYGLVLTDGIFMTSRDGVNWHKFDEAFVIPEIEHDRNWVYGDCYIAKAMIETPCESPAINSEISLYMYEGHWSKYNSPLYRYTIRIDGFASYTSGYEPSDIYTVPFTFDGDGLEINFKTSARGYIFVDFLDEYGRLYEEFKSMEIFGNSLQRRVFFGETDDISALAGKPVRMHIRMSDASIYSMRFIKK